MGLFCGPCPASAWRDPFQIEGVQFYRYGNGDLHVTMSDENSGWLFPLATDVHDLQEAKLLAEIWLLNNPEEQSWLSRLQL